MTAREYLLQLKTLHEEIDFMKEFRQDCIDKATSTSAFPLGEERVQTSRTDNGKVERYGTRAADIAQEIENKELELFTLEEKIIRRIRGLHHKHYINILYKIYVQFKSIREVAGEMKISYSYAVELHKKALKAFTERYAKKKVG